MEQTQETVIYYEETEGLLINRIRRSPGFTMPIKHLHDEYELYYLKEGERYYFIGSQTFHVKSGSLVLIDRNQIHQTSQAGSGSHDRILIGLKEEALSPLLAVTKEFSLSKFFERCSGVLELEEKDRKVVEQLLDQIARELAVKQIGYRYMAFSALASLFIHIERLLSAPCSPALNAPLSSASRHRKVDEVASYITLHYSEPMSLDSLARRFYVSKCYLSRIFKEATGFTVVEYINMCRIRQARLMLMSSNISITQVSEALGYDNITYFERVFKQYTLTSPLKFRKQYENKLQPIS